jgi:hypothetical protein
MGEQLQLLLEVVRRHKRPKKPKIDHAPESKRPEALRRLMLGVIVGAATRTVYEVMMLGSAPNFISLTTAIATAVVVLSFWPGLGSWLSEATPWWAQLLLGFSVGFLGQTILKEFVEVTK